MQGLSPVELSLDKPARFSRLLTGQSLMICFRVLLAEVPCRFRHSAAPSRLSLGLGIRRCDGAAACSKPEPAQEPVRSVKVLTVGLDEIRTGHEFAGEVRARVESRLGFRVAGKIIATPGRAGPAREGGPGAGPAGSADYQLAADAARAQVAAASTNRDLAAADFKRYVALKDQNFISGAELERRETTLKAAQAQLDQAKAQLAVARQPGGLHQPGGRRVGRRDRRRGRAGAGGHRRHAGGAHRRRTARATWCSRCPKTRWRRSSRGPT